VFAIKLFRRLLGDPKSEDARSVIGYVDIKTPRLAISVFKNSEIILTWTDRFLQFQMGRLLGNHEF